MYSFLSLPFLSFFLPFLVAHGDESETTRGQDSGLRTSGELSASRGRRRRRRIGICFGGSGGTLLRRTRGEVRITHTQRVGIPLRHRQGVRGDNPDSWLAAGGWPPALLEGRFDLLPSSHFRGFQRKKKKNQNSGSAQGVPAWRRMLDLQFPFFLLRP